MIGKIYWYQYRNNVKCTKTFPLFIFINLGESL